MILPTISGYQQRIVRKVRYMRFRKSQQGQSRLVYKSRRPYSTIRHRNRGYAIEEMKNLSDEQFRRMFRLSRTKFYALLDQIRLRIEPSDVGKRKATLLWGSYITAETRLAVTLRWLAGGSYLTGYQLCIWHIRYKLLSTQGSSLANY
jgi:hypothetical protein